MCSGTHLIETPGVLVVCAESHWKISLAVFRLCGDFTLCALPAKSLDSLPGNRFQFGFLQSRCGSPTSSI